MFNFLKKTSPPEPRWDFSVLGIDLHSHLIPGVDDGSPDVETSVKLIRGLRELGYRRLITTPHVMTDLYPNTPEIIRDGLARVQAALAEEGVNIQISAAAEYLIDEGFRDLLESRQILPLARNFVLVEMSFLSAPPNLYEDLFRLQTKGYQPILAHPERYLFLKENFEAYERLRDHGCLFQLNLLSLVGYYGGPIRDNALQLLKKNWVEFLGTDLHHERHLELLRRSLEDKTVQRVLKEYQFRNGELVS